MLTKVGVAFNEENVKFTCAAVGDPEPTINWVHGYVDDDDEGGMKAFFREDKKKVESKDFQDKNNNIKSGFVNYYEYGSDKKFSSYENGNFYKDKSESFYNKNSEKYTAMIGGLESNFKSQFQNFTSKSSSFFSLSQSSSTQTLSPFFHHSSIPSFSTSSSSSSSSSSYINHMEGVQSSVELDYTQLISSILNTTDDNFKIFQLYSSYKNERKNIKKHEKYFSNNFKQKQLKNQKHRKNQPRLHHQSLPNQSGRFYYACVASNNVDVVTFKVFLPLSLVRYLISTSSFDTVIAKNFKRHNDTDKLNLLKNLKNNAAKNENNNMHKNGLREENVIKIMDDEDEEYADRLNLSEASSDNLENTFTNHSEAHRSKGFLSSTWTKRRFTLPEIVVAVVTTHVLTMIIYVAILFFYCSRRKPTHAPFLNSCYNKGKNPEYNKKKSKKNSSSRFVSTSFLEAYDKEGKLFCCQGRDDSNESFVQQQNFSYDRNFSFDRFTSFDHNKDKSKYFYNINNNSKNSISNSMRLSKKYNKNNDEQVYDTDFPPLPPPPPPPLPFRPPPKLQTSQALPSPNIHLSSPSLSLIDRLYKNACFIPQQKEPMHNKSFDVHLSGNYQHYENNEENFEQAYTQQANTQTIGRNRRGYINNNIDHLNNNFYCNNNNKTSANICFSTLTKTYGRSCKPKSSKKDNNNNNGYCSYLEKTMRVNNMEAFNNMMGNINKEKYTIKNTNSMKHLCNGVLSRSENKMKKHAFNSNKCSNNNFRDEVCKEKNMNYRSNSNETTNNLDINKNLLKIPTTKLLPVTIEKNLEKNNENIKSGAKELFKPAQNANKESTRKNCKNEIDNKDNKDLIKKNCIASVVNNAKSNKGRALDYSPWELRSVVNNNEQIMNDKTYSSNNNSTVNSNNNNNNKNNNANNNNNNNNNNIINSNNTSNSNKNNIDTNNNNANNNTTDNKIISNNNKEDNSNNNTKITNDSNNLLMVNNIKKRILNSSQNDAKDGCVGVREKGDNEANTYNILEGEKLDENIDASKSSRPGFDTSKYLMRMKEEHEMNSNETKSEDNGEKGECNNTDSIYCNLK